MENLDFIFKLITSTFIFKFLIRFISLSKGFLFILGISFLIGCRFQKDTKKEKYFEIGTYFMYFSASFLLLDLLSKDWILN